MEVVSGLKHSATYVFRLDAGDGHGNSTGPGPDYMVHTRGRGMQGAGQSAGQKKVLLLWYKRPADATRSRGSTFIFAWRGYSFISFSAGRTVALLSHFLDSCRRYAHELHLD